MVIIGNFVLSVWILISPMILGFAASQQPKACWNAFAVGLAMMLVTMIFEGTTNTVSKVWRDLANLVLALWFMLSPWALGFGAHALARDSTTAAGILAAALALWAMTLDVDFRRWLHRSGSLR